MNSIVFNCEDSLEGVFTAIYTSYELKCDHSTTCIRTYAEDNIELFSEYINVNADNEKSLKVARTVNNTFGRQCYIMICQCLASFSSDKANSVYHMIVKGLSSRNKSNLINDLSDEYINRVFVMARESNNEILHLRGFLRFEELSNGVLFSKIGPKNNILTFLAPHFADRLPNENFVIYDEIRQIFVIHPAFKSWIVVTGDYLTDNELIKSADEEVYSSLFRKFCNSVAIKERRNIRLQTQMLPLRFQKYMMEFN